MDKLTSPSRIKEIIKNNNFNFNKRYGQNFLTDENILNKILEGANISQEDYILEIGPGIGTMTQALSERAKYVVAVEIDKKLIPILKDTLRLCDNVSLINEDVLKLDIKETLETISTEKFKVIANLPYYITSEIVMGLLEKDIPIKSITVMVQKEVAERMIASPGTKDYGSLSVAVQYYSIPSIVTIVPKTVFMPQPKVDSAVIHLDILQEPSVDVDPSTFFKIVRASFSMRRKTLLNCLSSGLEMDKELVVNILNKSNIHPQRRGETLSLGEFAEITKHYQKHRY